MPAFSRLGGAAPARRFVAERLVSAEEQLLDVAQDVELLGLHLGIENVDDVPGKAEARPELDEDFPDRLGVVRDPEHWPKDFLDEVQVLGGDLHVEGLKSLVPRKWGASHGLNRF